MSCSSKDKRSSMFSWEWLIQFRRTLHMYPETSFQEYVTAELVKNILINHARISPDYIRCNLGKDDEGKEGTGIIVDIMGEGTEEKIGSFGARKKKLIMFRADLDALRMQEENTEKLIPYHSRRPNCAHMCGHDGHVAALVGLAIILNNSSFKQMIPSNMGARLVFQPAEEYIGGAEPMIKLANCLEGVDEVYGWHNWPLVDLGTVLLKEGTVMAHETEFYITVKGQGGHASAPDKCIDPIVCACSIVSNLQTIVSRCLPSSTNSVISVTQLHGGPLNLDCISNPSPNTEVNDDQNDLMRALIKESATNVISDCCYLSGTIRDCDREKTFLDIVRNMKRIVKSVSEAHQCTGELEVVEQYMETRNTKDCVEIVRGCINASSITNTQNSLNNGNMFPTNIQRVTSEGLPLMGSEDFAYYLKERPGCFIIVGTKEEYFTNLTRFPFDLPKAKADVSSCKAISEQRPKFHYLEKDCTNEKDALSNNNIELENGSKEKCSLNNEHEEESQQQIEKLKRTNCCAHGSTFDFNDNVLPSVISLFLNIASERLISIESNRQLFKECIHVSEEGVFMQNQP